MVPGNLHIYTLDQLLVVTATNSVERCAEAAAQLHNYTTCDRPLSPRSPHDAGGAGPLHMYQSNRPELHQQNKVTRFLVFNVYFPALYCIPDYRVVTLNMEREGARTEDCGEKVLRSDIGNS